MDKLKNVKFDDIYELLDKIEKAHEKEGKTLNFNEKVEKLATFLPNISFRHFIELKLILREHDYIRYENFKKEHDYIDFDSTGTSPEHFSWWEIMLDMEDSTLETLKVNNTTEHYKDLVEAKELNKIGALKINSNYLLHRQLFLKKFGAKFPTFSARLDLVEAGLKKLEPNCGKFLCKVVYYCTKENNTKLFELILNRIDYLLADIALNHPSNVKYLEIIKKLSNN